MRAPKSPTLGYLLRLSSVGFASWLLVRLRDNLSALLHYAERYNAGDLGGAAAPSTSREPQLLTREEIRRHGLQGGSAGWAVASSNVCTGN